MIKKELLCIGHLCHDKVKDGYILGGSSSYASVIATHLDYKVNILTSVGDDFIFHKFFEENNIEIINIESEQTTVFENTYKGESRTQYIHARSNDISPDGVSEDMKRVPLVLIGSIAREIDYNITSYFKNSVIGGIIQGSMRTWDNNGLVFPATMDWDVLRDLDIVFISDDDISDFKNELSNIKKAVPHLVLTHGKDGATIYYDDREYFFPAFTTDEVDATGAGDTFSTAYLIKFYESHDVRSAAIYAHCAASIIIEGKGLSSVNNLSQIEERVREYHRLYPDV